ncbi:hypothetical protein OSH11_10540 [Kaistia dalseonensis]|uniref:Uncharacterized protein n=1 Tax=Kaistia dalseonensis TaxID=410840 RepID=A0ABU0H8D2_9HYPH|nr:hypothetical protein [Kaistia dalseonensis]MCX5495144.1 hypothetical protein [Kaistia dalseonensis]MDQ0437726.1 hypothetical protein [Kaistia dalseonensis]
MRRTLLALSLLFAASPAAFACTADELQAKSIEYASLVKAIVAKNPSQELVWKQKQINVARVAENTTDLDQICAAYDGGIAEAKAATK